MKQHLQLKLSQQLALTPQLQQAIRLLQLSTIELNQEIEHALNENPLLELAEDLSESGGVQSNTLEKDTSKEDKPFDDDSFEQDSTWENLSIPTANRQDDEHGEDYFSVEEKISLVDHLKQQLQLLPLTQKDKLIISQLIANINDLGYLETPLEEIMEQFPGEVEIELEEMKTCLKLLQTLDPPGICARTLAECLLIQLHLQYASDPYYHLAIITCKDHLVLLGNRDYIKLKKVLKITDEQLRSTIQLITQLNPKPAEHFFLQDTKYIIPDVIVKKYKKKWVAQLNPQVLPRLKINQLYANLLQKNNSSSSLQQQLQEARWLIKNVQQRFETILKVSQAIVDEQQAFFENGDISMRPMVLKEIADLVGLHESTISRVTTQKYLFSPRGIFELKYFFSSHVSTETGGMASSTSIRALIKQLITNENPKKPLSDNQISDILNERGIVVARRTVAKYRESMQIYPTNQRKVI
ncbi:RNA polymerase sigma-54 factor [Ferrovum sp. JA12]|uniref:RNA polymerase factor sigma-54 n=1 Tax=Ferrovum sp. JA12 TaxID=1356299 RepID=UPI000702EB16|nr:RNA polymerase factor sigma-54 [Ferrovum sp. JA12]KRH79502.1 RNA polymerase sigma-54 factor [Ferrovum sp. JA12]